MMEKGSILVVEDEERQRVTLAGFLTKRGYRVEQAASGEEALENLYSTRVDLVLTDQKMQGIDGLELLAKVKERNPDTEVILVTAFGDVPSAVQAVKQGAYEYLTKPVDLEKLEISLERALEKRRLVEENRDLRGKLAERIQSLDIVSVSGAMEAVLNLAARVARVDSPVLITGESGTGKEMVAKAIHAASERRDKPFVVVNCAALNRNLIESELFGHEKGAFTGAIRQRQGKLEATDGGSLFLDELGEISPEIQVKLLRFLQEHTFERVGSDRTLKADVRLITATNRDLPRAIAEGGFREDFYYRVNVVNIHIPPLRARREDIRPLVDHFLSLHRQRLGEKSLSREALDILTRYDFPGNIRELQNIIERAMVLSRGDVIGAGDFPASLFSHASGKDSPESDGFLTETLERLERRMILEALEASGSVQVKAAERLGLSERTLRYRMTKLGIK